jgi:hypothetical protein
MENICEDGDLDVLVALPEFRRARKS